MQKFDAPLTLEDKVASRRIERTVLIAYALLVLALAAGGVAQVVFENLSTADAPIEAST